jgi:PAS domain-containing protein
VERQSPEVKATAQRAGRLANLLTLSYEPMLAWALDGAIEFWNAGAERLLHAEAPIRAPLEYLMGPRSAAEVLHQDI